MTSKNWDLSEVRAFERLLKEAPKRMNRVGIQVTSNSVDRMVADAKRRVRKDTGKLAKDIRKIRKGKFGSNLVGAEFGVDSDRRGLIGIFIEKGFKHWRDGFIGPFPYLEPAADKYHDQWVQRLLKAAVKVIVRG